MGHPGITCATQCSHVVLWARDLCQHQWPPGRAPCSPTRSNPANMSQATRPTCCPTPSWGPALTRLRLRQARSVGPAGLAGPRAPLRPPRPCAQKAFVCAQPAGITSPRERTGRSPAADCGALVGSSSAPALLALAPGGWGAQQHWMALRAPVCACGTNRHPGPGATRPSGRARGGREGALPWCGTMGR